MEWHWSLRSSEPIEAVSERGRADRSPQQGGHRSPTGARGGLSSEPTGGAVIGAHGGEITGAHGRAVIGAHRGLSSEPMEGEITGAHGRAVIGVHHRSPQRGCHRSPGGGGASPGGVGLATATGRVWQGKVKVSCCIIQVAWGRKPVTA